MFNWMNDDFSFKADVGLNLPTAFNIAKTALFIATLYLIGEWCGVIASACVAVLGITLIVG